MKRLNGPERRCSGSYRTDYVLDECMSITDFLIRLHNIDGLTVNKIAVSEDVDADVGMHRYGDEEYEPGEFRASFLHGGSWGTIITVKCDWKGEEIEFSMCFRDEAYSPFDKFSVWTESESTDFIMPEDFEL